MRSHRTSLFAQSLCLAGTVSTLLGSALYAPAQTAPRYVGQYLDNIGSITGYRFFTDSGLIYNTKSSATGEYWRWENGVATVLTRPAGIPSGTAIISANDAGMILWTYNGTYLQYPNGTFTQIAAHTGVTPRSLNASGTVAVSNNGTNDQRLVNQRLEMDIHFPIEPSPPLLAMLPMFTNVREHALGVISYPYSGFQIYSSENRNPYQFSDYRQVEAPRYGANLERQFTLGVSAFNDNDEVAGGLQAIFPYPEYYFIYLPHANYGLSERFTRIPATGFDNGEGVIGFNTKGQLATGHRVWQNGVWTPLPFFSGNNTTAYHLNNTGQILGTYSSGGNSGFYLLTQVINVHGRIVHPGTPPDTLLATFQPDDASKPFTRTITPDANGDFHIENVPTRAYSVSFTVPGRLRRNARVDATQNNDDITLAPFDLLRGDANGDNAVDILDLLLLIAHYNQSQGTGDYLQACDFNTDGANDIADLLILIANYNQFGE